MHFLIKQSVGSDGYVEDGIGWVGEVIGLDGGRDGEGVSRWWRNE